MPFSIQGLYRKNISINNWWASPRCHVHNINEKRFTFRKTIEMSLLFGRRNRIENHYVVDWMAETDGMVTPTASTTTLYGTNESIYDGERNGAPDSSHLFNMYWHTLTAGVSFITLFCNPVDGFDWVAIDINCASAIVNTRWCSMRYNNCLSLG